MERFVDVNKRYTNVNNIHRFWRKNEENIYVELEEGEIKVINTKRPDLVFEELSGGDYLIQVIPVKEELFAVYKDDDSYFGTPIYYLGVFADGNIHGLVNLDGYFEKTNNCSNHLGDYHRYQLEEFPGIEIDGRKQKEGD